MSDDEDMIPQPHPFKAVYFPVENYWEIIAPQPMSVNDMYVSTIGKNGKQRRFLHNDAKRWKERVRDAVCDEANTHGDPWLRGMGELWARYGPMMYQMDWYARGRAGKEDLDGKLKLFQDSLNDSVIWQDDSQVMAFYPRVVTGAVHPGYIKVIIKPYSEELDLACLAPWINEGNPKYADPLPHMNRVMTWGEGGYFETFEDMKKAENAIASALAGYEMELRGLP